MENEFKVISGNTHEVEKQLNQLKAKYQIEIKGTTCSPKTLVLVIELTPKK